MIKTALFVTALLTCAHREPAPVRLDTFPSLAQCNVAASAYNLTAKKKVAYCKTLEPSKGLSGAFKKPPVEQ